MSARANASSRGSGTKPSALIASSATPGSTTHTSRTRPLKRRATARPTAPKPTTATVSPESWWPLYVTYGTGREASSGRQITSPSARFTPLVAEALVSSPRDDGMVADGDVAQRRQAQAEREVRYGLRIAPRRMYDGYATRPGRLEVNVDRLGTETADDLEVAHLGQHYFVDRL